MTNYIYFLLVAVLGALMLGQSNAQSINCYLCSSLNTSSGGNCMVPDGNTAVCISSWNVGFYGIGSTNAAIPVGVYTGPQCTVTVYYNGNRSPYRIDRNCIPASSAPPTYAVTNWVGYNTSFCATSLCNSFSASPRMTSSSYLIMSLTSLAAMVIMYSEKMAIKS